MSRRSPFGNALLGPAGQSPRRLRIRVQLLLTAMLVTTQLVGAAVAGAITVFVLPSRALTAEHRLALAIATPSFLVVGLAIGITWSTRCALRATRWVIEEREPSARERRRTLRLPWAFTAIQAGIWGAALILFDVLALVLQPVRLFGITSATVISGVVVAGITYLLSEFALRPVAARALSGPPLRRRGVVGVGGRMLLFWTIGTGAPVFGLVVAGVVALVSNDISRQRLAVIVLSLAGVVLIFGLLVTWLNSRAVVAPVITVRRALERVRHGRFDTEVAVFDGTELGRLQAGFNDMVAGLREREAIREMFGRHVGHEVAAAATSRNGELGGETRDVTVLFVDLAGSTGFAQHRDPQHVVATLNQYFAVVVAEVAAERGLINKFMGDAALAIFGAPEQHPDHAGAGLRAARAVASRLAAEVTEVRAGIGVATGEVVAGNIGGADRFEYTVIGDAVNSAARLCDQAKQVPGRVLTTTDCLAAAGSGETGHWQDDRVLLLRGRDTTTRTARLRDQPDSVELTTGNPVGTP